MEAVMIAEEASVQAQLATSTDDSQTDHLPESPSFVGQAITCGGWSIVLNIAWTNTIIDTFELVKIPRSPSWLIGAVNVDGSIIPVVDLSVYFVPNAPAMQIDRHHRMLVGGKRDDNVETISGSASDNVFAILFNGLPSQIQYTRESIDDAIIIPDYLRELCLGIAKDSAGKTYFEMNTDRFIEYLSLSLI